MAHTPGPWQVGHGADADKIRGGNPPATIAEIWFRPERFDNARLIAASPKLLAALEAVEWIGGDDNYHCPMCLGIGNHELDCQLAAALAEAKGG